MSSDSHLDLIRKARATLDSQELVDRDAEKPRDMSRNRPAPGSPNPKDDHVLMYRGKVIRRGSGATPGAPSTGRRPAAPSRGGSGGGADDTKAALARLTELYTEGLITKAEYGQKRSEILDRI